MHLRAAAKWAGIQIGTMLFGVGICTAAPITYHVNQTIGLGSVTGTIQTDGTTSGALGTGNIVAWDLELNGLGASYNITDANSVVLVVGSDVTATATDLSFNFSGSDGGYLLFQQGLFSGLHYYCDATVTAACYQGASVTPEAYSSSSFQNVPVSGNVIIGTTAIPEPASTVLFGAGGIGLAMLRRRRSC